MHNLSAFFRAGLFALVSLVFCAVTFAQSGNFIITQHGHNVGTASYSMQPAADGFDSTSIVKISMQGLEFALSKSETLSADHRLHHVQLSGIVNGSAVTLTAKPDAAEFLLNISANGRSTTTRLASHPATVLLADFDPGAMETLLTLASAQNNRDLWAIIPKKAGSIEQVQIATYADEHGTWNGQAIAVHHLVATIGGAKTDLFTNPKNELLQAELPQEGFSLIRDGFVLTPPSKPIAPTE